MDDSDYNPPETPEGQLDEILSALWYNKLQQSEIDHQQSAVNFDEVCELLKLPKDEATRRYYLDVLYSDGYIEPLHHAFRNSVRITSQGVRFINDGGYKQLVASQQWEKEKEELEMKNTRTQISANRWSKYGVIAGIIISLISLALSIVSLVNSKG